MDSVIQQFLQTLPKHIGASSEFVYKNLIDDDRNGKLQYQEIYNYIHRNEASLKNWYDSKPKRQASYIETLKRKLFQDLTIEFDISEISPKPDDTAVKQDAAAQIAEDTAIEQRKNNLIAAQSHVSQLLNDAQLFTKTGWILYIELDTYNEYKSAFIKACASLNDAYSDLNYENITSARNNLITSNGHFSKAIEGLDHFLGSWAKADAKAGAKKELENVGLYIGRVNRIIEELDNLSD